MSPGHQLVQASADKIPPVRERAVNVNLLFLNFTACEKNASI